MTLPRRRFLSGAAAAVAAPWLASGARAADVERFSLGVASASRAPTAWCSGPG
jgi:hypothetical protein